MREITLRPYQLEAVEDLRQGAREGHKNQLLVAPTGAGKCLGFNTPILMADGSTKMVQDVVPGDRLLGPDGSARNVLSIARGREAMFTVEPVKGDAYRCNASHLLSLKVTTIDHNFTLADGSRVVMGSDLIVTTAECLYRSSKTAKHLLKGWRSPPIDSFPDAPIADLPIPPYILGAWLGDGHRRTPTISKPACKMVDAWIEYAASIGMSIRMEDSAGCPSWHITGGRRGSSRNPFTAHLRSLGLGAEKFVPIAYQTADHKSRSELLAGLLDSDGSVRKGGFDWISKDKELADGLAFVCRSLGLSAYVNHQRKGIKSTGFSAMYWRVSISGDFSDIPLKDKIPADRGQKKRTQVHGIALKPEPEDNYYGFEIDGDRLFLLGDFTVTHNTVIATHLMDSASKRESKVDFIVDRVQLVNQTSAMLDYYGLDHGVMQAGHWRNRPSELIQVCSAQTAERRGFRADTSLILIDEVHSQRSSISEHILNTRAKVIGLTATPFTEGLSKLFTRISNVTTTNRLIDDGFLTPIRAYEAVEANMKGAKIVAGEYSAAEIEKRGQKIIGDIVTNWVEKTNEHYGGPVKTIVFSATVTHGLEICKQFKDAGFRFEQISYETDPDERAELIAEFGKPDSQIMGLVSVDALAKGFDVPDVCVGVCARPLRRSLSTHIQMIGRIARIAPGSPKAQRGYAIWLDHTGNYRRFSNDMDQLFEHGVKELDDGQKDKEVRKELDKKEKKDIVCQCGMVLLPSMKVCPACGRERVKKSLIEAVPGSMVEIASNRPLLGPNGKPLAAWMQDKTEVWCQMSTHARDIAARKGLSGNDDYVMRLLRGKWKSWYGEWPNYAHPSRIDKEPSSELRGRWMRDNIAWAKSKARERT